MSVVYITHDPGHDFGDAARFGGICVITKSPVDIFNPDKVLRMMEDALSAFREEEDYLLLSGATIACALAMGVLARSAKRVRLLVFDVKTRKYTTRHVTLNKEKAQ